MCIPEVNVVLLFHSECVKERVLCIHSLAQVQFGCGNLHTRVVVTKHTHFVQASLNSESESVTS